MEVATGEIDNLMADWTLFRLPREERTLEAKCVSFHVVRIQTLPMVDMSTKQEEQLLMSLVLLNTDGATTYLLIRHTNVFFAVIH